jgi:hypothetical protein
MKLEITNTNIAVETYLNGEIVLARLEYNEGDAALGVNPYFVLVDEKSDDFPILWENQEVTIHKGWFIFEDVQFGEVKFKFAGY